MIELHYGNTNTFLIQSRDGFLLLDTGYVGELNAFYKAIKAKGVQVKDIAFVLATHYHPDHIGLIPDLTDQGVRLLLTDTQTDAVHDSDRIFAREPKLNWRPIRESEATVLSCSDSRAFFRGMGIDGEIVSTPSHSRDSVSLLLDSGDCFVGDLERRAVLAGYDRNLPLQRDWETVMARRPKRIFYAHGREENIF
ncbi:MAG: MBL fold metallo-hydrolase [Clostridia bacterium]|nr:MBL fold metallo-hydrolase [Clostridia bacterium]